VKLPKQPTTVINLSKIIALILFVTVLMLTFILGKNYQFNLDNRVMNKNTTHWKVFTSKKAGFSFEYSPNWPLVVETDAELKGDDPWNEEPRVEGIDFSYRYFRNAHQQRMGYIIVKKIDTIKSLQDYIKKIDDDYEKLSPEWKKKVSKQKIQYLTISGEKAIKLLDSETELASFSPPTSTYIIIKNGLIYEIALLNTDMFRKNENENTSSFFHILSTFKFIK